MENNKHDVSLEENVENSVEENVENIQDNGQIGENGDSELQKVTAQLEEQKEKYVRLFAEFDNFKRRNAKERMELIQTAGKEVIVSLLDVLDDCERAEKQIQNTNDIEQIKEGVQLVFNKLRSNLTAKGIKPMNSVGSDFDVEKHEALTEIEAGEEKKGKVVDEVVKGYYLNDKLIRFAKVVVGK